MTKQMRAVALAAMLAACAHSVELTKHESQSDFQLSASDSILVSVPQDGVYGSNVYSGSGRNTAQILSAEFARHTSLISVQASHNSMPAALAQARTNGQDYLVHPLILHWEDRATEWSGRPDRVEIRIDVIDVSSGEVVVSGMATGKSRWVTLGGDHPQDLLPEPIDEFVSSLY